MCRFRFTIYFEPAGTLGFDRITGWWFSYMEGVGYRFHNGHIQKKEHEVTKWVALLNKNELQITDESMDINLSSQSMAMMFMQCTNLVVSPQKLHNHHAKSQKKKAFFVT